MGRPGDLVLVFADALTRSWKQIIKFRPEGPAEPVAVKPRAPVAPVEAPREEPALSDFDGVVRDERGVHLSREDAD
jgi:cyanophycin synthetase